MPCQKNLGVFCNTSDPSLCVLGNEWVGSMYQGLERKICGGPDWEMSYQLCPSSPAASGVWGGGSLTLEGKRGQVGKQSSFRAGFPREGKAVTTLILSSKDLWGGGSTQASFVCCGQLSACRFGCQLFAMPR